MEPKQAPECSIATIAETSMFSRSLKILAGAVMLSSSIGPYAFAADMIENYNPPRPVRVVHHAVYRHAVYRHHVQAAYEERSDRLDCGQVLYEYRTSPPYTEIKTMCGPRPIVYDTGMLVQR
jgi:hypothetical protein